MNKTRIESVEFEKDIGVIFDNELEFTEKTNKANSIYGTLRGQLTWTPLSKRRENSCLILFYKIINNLAVVPHSCLEKADVRTRKKHSQKFRHIGYNIDPYGQSFFPNCISAWNGLAKDIAEANTLDIFKSKLQN